MKTAGCDLDMRYQQIAMLSIQSITRAIGFFFALHLLRPLLVKRLKNLSSPAAIGTNPNSTRSAHHVVFSRLSVFCILPPVEWSRFGGGGYNFGPHLQM